MDKQPTSPNYVSIMGQSFHKVELLKLCGYVLLALIVIAGIAGHVLYDYFTVSQDEEQLIEQQLVEADATDKPDEDMGPVERFIQHHFDVTQYNEINSIRAQGTYTADGVELDF